MPVVSESFAEPLDESDGTLDTSWSGRMVVDSEKKTVEGPFDEATVSADPRVQGITPVEASVAWKKLESAT
jgi:hypothetical protein